MIYYGTPYSTDKKIGQAYNHFMSLLPNAIDFGCLVDADTLFTTYGYGHQIAKIVEENPDARLFYARTNRIACPWQRDSTVRGDDIRRHRTHGKLLAEMHGTSVREVQNEKTPGSGFLILLRKDLWQEVPFKTSGILGVDWDFFRRVASRKERILQMLGVYLYHWYRGGKSANTRHLK